MERSRFFRSGQSVAEPLLRPLFDDVIECDELLDRSDNQFARRTFVRAAFAFNEGYVYWLKEHVTRWLLEESSRTSYVPSSKGAGQAKSATERFSSSICRNA